MDLLQKNVQKILQKLDGDALDVELGREFQHRVSGSFQVYLTIGQVYRKIPPSFLHNIHARLIVLKPCCPRTRHFAVGHSRKQYL